VAGHSDPKNLQKDLSETLPVGSRERSDLKTVLHPRRTHGGPSSRGKRKTKRPFVTGAPTHLVLSSDRARGAWSLNARKNRARVSSQIYTYANRFKVRVYRAKVSSRQIQLLVKASERKHLADFLRVLAGRVAIRITGAKKRIKRTGKFWNELCWSKVLNWGHEFFSIGNQIFSTESGKSLTEPFPDPMGMKKPQNGIPP